MARRKHYKHDRQHNRQPSGLSKFFAFVMRHKLLIISLLAIVGLFTLRGASAFWVTIILIAVGPGIMMFIIYNLIAKAIWKR